MADTRNPSGHPDNLSRQRSLLRRQRPGGRHSPVDKRPAGPSSVSDPGMGSPSSPLPPGTRVARQDAALAHPKVAGSFRFDFAHEVEEDPAFQVRRKDAPDER